MKRVAKFVALGAAAMSFALAGNAFAGTRSVVNQTNFALVVVAIPRTSDANDVVDNERPVALVVLPGQTQTLTYSAVTQHAAIVGCAGLQSDGVRVILGTK
jgi:hypothetical protein